MKVGFHTFGCKLNQFETEALASALRSQGCFIVTAEQPADAYVVNTCTVTAKADHKARALVRSLARLHPGSTVVVTGCSAQVEARRLAALGRNVVVVPQDRKDRLLDLPRLIAAEGDLPGSFVREVSRSGASDPFALRAGSSSFHARAFLKIQDGCDGACAYCRVPLARGGSVCLDVEEVIRRATHLEASGFREIVLTGVNVSRYQSHGVDLGKLLRAVLSATVRARLRISSLEPEAVSQALAAELAHPRVCPHFHLPVQSGSDEVLRGMRRRYTSTRVREAVSTLKQVKPDPFVACDLMTGYPGEGAAEFDLTRALVEEAGFAALHVFPFSPRPGTPAASLLPRGVRAHASGP